MSLKIKEVGRVELRSGLPSQPTSHRLSLGLGSLLALSLLPRWLQLQPCPWMSLEYHLVGESECLAGLHPSVSPYWGVGLVVMDPSNPGLVGFCQGRNSQSPGFNVTLQRKGSSDSPIFVQYVC